MLQAHPEPLQPQLQKQLLLLEVLREPAPEAAVPPRSAEGASSEGCSSAGVGLPQGPRCRRRRLSRGRPSRGRPSRGRLSRGRLSRGRLHHGSQDGGLGRGKGGAAVQTQEPLLEPAWMRGRGVCSPGSHRWNQEAPPTRALPTEPSKSPSQHHPDHSLPSEWTT